MSTSAYYCQVIDDQIVKYNVPAIPGLDDDGHRAIGYWPVKGDRPQADEPWQYYTGPEYATDVPTQTVNRVYTLGERSLEDYREDRCRSVDELYAAKILQGFIIDLGEGPETMQVFSLAHANVYYGSLQEYRAEVVAGNGAAQEAWFRPLSNKQYWKTYTEGVGLLEPAVAYFRAMLHYQADVKDHLRNENGVTNGCTTHEAVRDYDITAGWPSNDLTV